MATIGEAKRGGRRTIALMVVAAILWFGAWVSIRGAFMVWLIMFCVYAFALSASIIFIPESRRTPAFLAWQTRFFETSGWVVVSGLLAFAFVVVIGMVVGIVGGIGGWF